MKPVRTALTWNEIWVRERVVTNELDRVLPDAPPWRCHTDLHINWYELVNACSRRSPREDCECLK